MKKTCKKCKIEKDLDCFYKQKKGAMGRHSFCKLCHGENVYMLNRRYDICVKRLYRGMVKRCKNDIYYVDIEVKFTMEWFEAWIETSNFKGIHEEWVVSCYDTKLSPTVDRIDRGRGYEKDNIQILTMSDNCKKARVDNPYIGSKNPNSKDYKKVH